MGSSCNIWAASSRGLGESTSETLPLVRQLGSDLRELSLGGKFQQVRKQVKEGKEAVPRSSH